MGPERSERIAELVELALQHEPAERAGFLDQACCGTPQLRAEIDSLLAFQDQAHDFIETPAYANVAETALQNAGELRPGQMLGDLRVVSLLAEGGMGEVYLAEDITLSRMVAIKLVKAGLGTASLIRHFRNEERILAGLNHPNIARLYDAAITEGGLPYFVMEFVEGERIDDYCREKKLSIPQRLHLFRRVCAAVAYAHQHLVIHRDLKPANIRVTPDGEPKLLDFGIAKLLDPETEAMPEQTITMQAVMTPDYASPEQVRGESMSTASDVYGLGVVLYELLTGQRPYRLTSRRPDEIARAITEHEPTRPSAAIENRESASARITNHDSRSLRGDLDNIILKCLRKEPERRYASAAQLSEDIRRHLNGLPVAARKDTLGYRTAKFVARNRIAVIAAAVVAMAILAGLIIALWQADKAREQRDVAQRERIKAERINQFLQSMLSFSNQSVSSLAVAPQKKDVTVNEMLDQITPQIETELTDQPDVRAQVLRTIGSAYVSQGRFDLAEKNLRTAFETQKRLYGAQHQETIATMLQLAALAVQKLKFDEAADLFQKCVAFYREQKRVNSPDFKVFNLASALDALGTAKLYQGEPMSAKALYNEALPLAEKADLHGTERAIVAGIQRDLGGLLIRTGELKSGEDLLRKSLAQDQKIFQKPRWETGATLTMLGELLNHKNEPGEAEEFLREGEEIYQTTLGRENVYLAYNLYQQALALDQMKNLEQAEATARESVRISGKVLGNDSGSGASKGTLGMILLQRGRPKEAEEQFRRAIEVIKIQSPKDPALLVEVEVGLSQCLLAQNRADEAEGAAAEACNDARKNLTGENPIRKIAVNVLKQIHERRAQPRSTP